MANTTKEEIVNTAVELFSRRSYNNIGIQEIVDKVGIKKATFYHHFKSKKELTLIAIDQMWEFYKNDLLDPVFKSKLSINDKFEKIMIDFYKFHTKNKKDCGFMIGCRLGNIALELSTQDEDIRKKVEEKFTNWMDYFYTEIEQSVSNGELPENTDIDKSSKAILAYIEGVALFGKTFNNPEILISMKEGINNQIILRK